MAAGQQQGQNQQDNEASGGGHGDGVRLPAGAACSAVDSGNGNG